MHAGKSRDEPENAVVWSSYPVKEIKYRKSDRDENTLKGTESKNGDRRSEGQGEFSPAEPSDPAKLRHVDQAYRGIHDHGSQRRAGKRREDRTEEDDGQDHRADRHDRVQLATAPHCVADRRPAPATAHRKTLSSSDRKIGHTEGQKLLVTVKRGGVPRLEGAGREDVVGERDHGDSQRGWHQIAKVAGLEMRKLQTAEARVECFRQR